MRSFRFKELSIRYDAALFWIACTIGKPIRGRLAQASKILQDISNQPEDANGFVRGSQALSALLSVAPDVTTIIEIVEMLERPGCDPDAYKQRLKKILKGPLFAGDERPGPLQHPRNTQFELYLENYLSTAGLPLVENASTNDGAHDLDGTVLLTECKRVSSLSGVEEAMRKAKRQLESAMNEHGVDALAIIALDATKIHNPRGEILEAGTERAARDAVEYSTEQISAEVGKTRFPKYILGVFIHEHITVVNELRSFTLSQWTFWVNPEMDPGHKTLLETFNQRCRERSKS